MRRRIFIPFAACLWLFACTRDNQPPVAAVLTVPETGDTTTVFMLDGKNSTDAETSWFALRYRWDTDGDGQWDTDWSARSTHAARFGLTGFRIIRLEVMDEDGLTGFATDSVFILKTNGDTSTMTDPRDGNTYRTVRIADTWWMAENLRYGTPIDRMVWPVNNNIAEYLYPQNHPELAGIGGLYTWMEVHQYPLGFPTRDICPPGWSVPTVKEWNDLTRLYPQPFDVIYFFGPSSVVNLGISLEGFYRYGDPDNPMLGSFINDRKSVRYWSSGFTGRDSLRFFTAIQFTRDSAYGVQSFNRPEWKYHPNFPGYIIGYYSPEACFVRCLKK